MKKEQEKGGDEKKMRTIRMGEEDWRAIRVEAARRGMTASELVRQVMVDFVDGHKKLGEKR